MSELYERIEKLCSDSNITITAMCKESGASRASITDLKKGRKQSLSAETLSKIAAHFNVTVDYLISGNEQKEMPSEESEDITLNDFTYAMHNETKELTDSDRYLLLSLARQLNDARKKKDGENSK